MYMTASWKSLLRDAEHTVWYVAGTLPLCPCSPHTTFTYADWCRRTWNYPAWRARPSQCRPAVGAGVVPAKQTSANTPRLCFLLWAFTLAILICCRLLPRWALVTSLSWQLILSWTQMSAEGLLWFCWKWWHLSSSLRSHTFPLPLEQGWKSLEGFSCSIILPSPHFLCYDSAICPTNN